METWHILVKINPTFKVSLIAFTINFNNETKTVDDSNEPIEKPALKAKEIIYLKYPEDEMWYKTKVLSRRGKASSLKYGNSLNVEPTTLHGSQDCVDFSKDIEAWSWDDPESMSPI